MKAKLRPMDKRELIPNPEPQMAFADMISEREKLTARGFYPAEEKQLKVFAMSDGYPRTCVVERTGTTYTINGPAGAVRLLKSLRFANVGVREHVAQPALPGSRLGD